ncbi:TspO/MBR family protein [Pseudomarimonas salicorniae]|uniref:Tryptophan-rich sensory protein n=1 Tax=Pseudomarimonas salicorniae TaxID=2933270 RepID=A0ABT0GFD4_9GAMM|nr:TspO/MBR family protein [Lysobacter sp. CAU 1642]MCK7593254.1 tryptophan-rich sensory protein [Lysobacter sp. CAU 1642]
MNSQTMSIDPERSWPSWAISITVVAAVMLVGSAFPAGEWYQSLAKPTWQPPPWIFGPVWSAIYAALAASLALLLQAPPSRQRRRSLVAFGVMLLLNAAWTPLFFGLQSPLLAFADVILLWIAAVCSVLTAAAARPGAAWLQLPNLLWVSFALVLNGVILALNW